MRVSARFSFIALSLLASMQMLWWAHLIMSQQSLIAELINSPLAFEKARTYHLMIFAEGVFFFGVLSFGIWMAYKSLAKELKLQRSHSDFLSAITHELKTPITNVRLCLDTLERSHLPEETKTRYIQRAQLAVDKLVEEVETILAISSKNNLARDKQVFDLNDLISTVIQETQILKNTQIVFKKENPQLIAAPYEESRLILRNLLDNALKYSGDSSGAVNIQLQSEKNRVVAKIIDNGIGLTTEEAAHAFEPFYRGEDGRKLDPTGTGLGLPLVRRLADAFGIEISLNSKGRGFGTTANVSWPAEKTI